MKTKNIFLSLFFFGLAILLAACSHTHVFEEEWVNDDTHHWHNPICEHTTEVGSKEEHDWETVEVIVAATCTEKGSSKFKCSVCGVEQVLEVAALRHDLVTVNAQAATCEEAGWDTYDECSRCDYNTKVEIPATGHFAMIDMAVEPTCTETGLTEGSHCGICNKVLVKQELVAAPNHSIVYVNAKEATCTKAGHSAGAYCSECDYVIEEVVEIPALGHTVVVDPKVEASCTVSGLTEGSHCGVCNELLKPQEVIFPSHKEVVDIAVEPTCTLPGLTAGSHCSVCNIELSPQQEIPALGHTEEVLAKVDATCAKVGLTEGKKCSVCNLVLVAQEEIPTVAHNFTSDYLKGTKTCSNCSTSQNLVKSTYTIVGTFNNWNVSGTKMYKTEDANILRIDLQLAKGTTEFKVTPAGNWNTSYGNNGTIIATTWATSQTGWVMSTSQGNCKLSINVAGVYTFEFNIKTKAVYVSGGVGVIGSINGENWDTDHFMTYQGNGVFTVDIEMKKGSFEYKVRTNAAWTTSWGASLGGNNAKLTVNEAGLYRFTIDFVNRKLTAVLVG